MSIDVGMFLAAALTIVGCTLAMMVVTFSVLIGLARMVGLRRCLERLMPAEEEGTAS